MFINNKRIVCSVANSNEDLDLQGDANLNDDGKLVTLSGQFVIKGDIVGSFYYCENERGNVSKNITEIPAKYQFSASELLDNTIKELLK